jgi:hypothetical protein
MFRCFSRIIRLASRRNLILQKVYRSKVEKNVFSNSPLIRVDFRVGWDLHLFDRDVHCCPDAESKFALEYLSEFSVAQRLADGQLFTEEPEIERSFHIRLIDAEGS